MLVTLSKLDIDVPAIEFAKSCKTDVEFSSIICELAERVQSMDESGRRMFINSIIPEMSINGRDFIKDLYCSLLHFDSIENIDLDEGHIDGGDYQNT